MQSLMLATVFLLLFAVHIHQVQSKSVPQLNHALQPIQHQLNRPDCTDNSDCDDGLECVKSANASICYPPELTCTGGKECPSGWTCAESEGICIVDIPCNTEVDCPDGLNMTCEAGKCRPRICDSQSDCPGELVCLVNVCVDVERVLESICFAAHNVVRLENGARKRMDRLAIGDKVQVAHNVFSEVFMFTHRVHDVRAKFVKLDTADGTGVTLTPGHYVYVNGKLVQAGSVSVGDYVELADGKKVAVSRVSREMHTGLYNPQTLHGDIVVNGVRASTYTTAVQNMCAHAMLSPLRYLYEKLGVSTRVFDKGASEHLISALPKGSKNA